MDYINKDYSEEVYEIHDSLSNNIIDLYRKERESTDINDKEVYQAMIRFYINLKEAMDTTHSAIEKIRLKTKEMNIK